MPVIFNAIKNNNDIELEGFQIIPISMENTTEKNLVVIPKKIIEPLHNFLINERDENKSLLYHISDHIEMSLKNNIALSDTRYRMDVEPFLVEILRIIEQHYNEIYNIIKANYVPSITNIMNFQVQPSAPSMNNTAAPPPYNTHMTYPTMYIPSIIPNTINYQMQPSVPNRNILPDLQPHSGSITGSVCVTRAPGGALDGVSPYAPANTQFIQSNITYLPQIAPIGLKRTIPVAPHVHEALYPTSLHIPFSPPFGL